MVFLINARIWKMCAQVAPSSTDGTVIKYLHMNCLEHPSAILGSL